MDTLVDRLVAFIAYKKISDREFQRIIGSAPGQLNAIKRANTEFKSGKRELAASLNSISVETILQKFPELSPAWLMCGRGGMLGERIDENEELAALRMECYEKANKIITLMEENTTIQKELLAAKMEIDRLRG